MANRRGHCGDLRGRFLKKRAHGAVNGQRIDERLVALDIYEDIAGFVDGYLGDAFGSGAMIGTSHACVPPEGLNRVHNALVVGGDQDGVNGLRAFGPFINVLNHWLSTEGDQWLAGESGGTEAGGNYDDDFGIRHGSSSLQRYLSRC